MLGAVASVVGHSQYACGCNGGETSFPHLFARVFSDIVRASKLSATILFVDVATAFTTLLRRIDFNTDVGHEG